MTYVDALMKWPTPIKCFQNGSCHMIADTLDELHEMAARIGLKRSWFQSGGRTSPHYDLTPSRRIEAVRLGAVELDRRAYCEKRKSLQQKGGRDE